MKYLIMLMMIPHFCLSNTQILISESSLSRQGVVRALVLNSTAETNHVSFQVCDFQSDSGFDNQYQISNCNLIGKSSGYSLAEIENRIQSLENQSMRRAIVQTTYVILGTAVGAVTGGLAAQQLAIRNHPSQMYSLISYFAGGVLVGGASGLTLTVLTKSRVSDLLAQQDNGLIKQARSTLEGQVSLVVLKTSLQKTVNDFQEILLGIP